MDLLISIVTVSFIATAMAMSAARLNAMPNGVTAWMASFSRSPKGFGAELAVQTGLFVFPLILISGSIDDILSVLITFAIIAGAFAASLHIAAVPIRSTMSATVPATVPASEPELAPAPLPEPEPEPKPAPVFEAPQTRLGRVARLNEPDHQKSSAITMWSMLTSLIRWNGIATLAVGIVGVAVIAIVLFVWVLPTSVSVADVISKGENLYGRECQTCHGESGERLPISPLNSKEFLDSRGDATLLTVITEGKGIMPAFGENRGGPLNVDQVRAVVAYINSQAGRDSASLLADTGSALFASNCISCHGESGERIPIAPLNSKGFLDIRTDAQLIEAISQGTGPMPGFSSPQSDKLSNDDVTAIVAFLRHNVAEQVAKNASLGRELYLGNCVQCHGAKGDRIPNIELASPSFLRSVGDGKIIFSVNDGSGVMPGFGVGEGGSMSVPDVAALLAYLKSWAGVDTISALVAPGSNEGSELFLRNCAACHGEEGDRVGGVRLMDKSFLDRITDPVLLDTITRGNAQGMPAWGQAAGGPLDDTQINSVIEFLHASADDTLARGGGASSGASGGAPAAPETQGVAFSAADVDHGRDVFQSTCVACHGTTRDLIPTCRLTDPAFFEERGDEHLIESITFGRGSMPSWGEEKGGPLSPQDVLDVLGYLKSEVGLSLDGGSAASQPAAAPAAGPAVSAELIAQGQNVFASNCVACHGETRDKIPTCQLAEPTWLEDRGFDGIVTAITNGKPPLMPTWGGTLSDDDITAVATYLFDAAGAAAGAAVAPPEPVAAPLSAELSAKGKDVFTSNCIACHGETRDNIATCQLAEPTWLEERGFDGIVTAITNGKPPLMPTWGGTLSDDDITAVATYLFDAAGAAAGATNHGANDSPVAATVSIPAETKQELTVASLEAGREIFMGICQMCHGETGLNIPQCPIGSKQWLSNISEDGLKLRIRRGKPSAGMPSWGQEYGGPLSEVEIQSVVFYLGSASK